MSGWGAMRRDVERELELAQTSHAAPSTAIDERARQWSGRTEFEIRREMDRAIERWRRRKQA